MSFDSGARTLKYRQLNTSAPVSVDTGSDSGTVKTLGDLVDERVDVNDGGKETVKTVVDSGSVLTINLADGNIHDVTLTDNCTLTLTGATAGVGCSITLLLRQDGTGSRTVTWPASVDWPAGNTPTLETTANELDVISLFTLDGGTTWFGFHFAGGSLVVAFDDLSDVMISGPFVGEVPTYNGTAWVNDGPPSHIHVTGETGVNGDGTTTVWILTNFAEANTVAVWVNGTRNFAFTHSGDTVTFDSAPAASATVRFDYIAEEI